MSLNEEHDETLRPAETQVVRVTFCVSCHVCLEAYP